MPRDAARRATSVVPRDPWIGDLFGPAVHTGSLALAAADPDALAPVEAAMAARFAPGRRRAFAAGRQCARGLLAALGAGVSALPADAHRAPAWPEGVVGSISHGTELCVVAVGWRGVVRGLGVDVESDAPLAAPLRRRVCSDEELRRLEGAPEDEAGRIAKLTFSAKEAVYKCVHPLWTRPLGFHAVEILFEPDPGAQRGRFRARALPAAGAGAAALVDALSGAFAVRGGLVLAGATLPGADGGSA
jgi:4'-phosphopantetheinyl transferase EntD